MVLFTARAQSRFKLQAGRQNEDVLGEIEWELVNYDSVPMKRSTRVKSRRAHHHL